MDKKIARWFYAAMVLGLCILLSAAVLSVVQPVVIDNEAAIPFNEGWQYSINDSTVKEGSITLPLHLPAHQNDRVYLYNTLPAVYPEGMTICFRSSSQYVRVWVGGQEIYQFGHQDSRPFGRSPGSAWNLIRLQRDTVGSEVVIELSSPYEAFSGDTAPIYYGSKNANVFKIIKDNMPGFVTSSIILLVSLLLFIVYAFARRSIKITFLLYLAWFSLLAGLWSLAEARVAQVVVNNLSALMLCSCTAMMLWPIPLLLFITETHPFHNKKPYYLLCFLFLANFVLVMGLQVFQLVDLLESIFTAQLLMLISIVVLVRSILIEIIKYKNKDIYVLSLGTSVFISLPLLDLFRYYMGISMDNSFFFRIAVLFYLLILVYYTVSQLMKMLAQNMRTKMLEQLAFLDLLTNLKNRTAFEKEMEPYRTGADQCKGLWIGIFDVNNLKLVNDTHGHKAGDNLLADTVHCLKAVFQEHGELYRIGGDEFALLMKALTDDEAAALLEQFEQEVERSRQAQSSTLCVAYGLAKFDPSLDQTADGLYVRADGYMYENKRRTKAT